MFWTVFGSAATLYSKSIICCHACTGVLVGSHGGLSMHACQVVSVAGIFIGELLLYSVAIFTHWRALTGPAVEGGGLK